MTHQPRPVSSTSQSPGFFSNARDTSVGRDLISVAGNHTVHSHTHIYNPPHLQLQEEARNALHDIIARNAMHDGDQRTEGLEFHPDTQRTPRANIIQWVLDIQRLEDILWLKGAIGTGKSALSKKIADMFHGGEVDGQLAASFFFLREDPTRNHPGKFAVTIAYRLAVSFPEVGERIGAAITRDRTLLTAEITHQWAELVVRPVKEVITSTIPAVIVIDGLDQCGTAANQVQILDLISSCGSDFPIAFLITSRPDPHLLNAFEENFGRRAVMHYKVTELGDSEETRAEMKTFLHHSFSSIRKKNPTAFPSDVEWPDEQTIDKILDWAFGRYLLLSTIIQAVGSDKDPRAALEKVLDKMPTYNQTVTPQKLVIAIDIGTTYSGVSYRFPGQNASGGDPRIPSVVIYDRFGNIKAVGARTENPALQVQAEDEGLSRAEWFKLHLRPKELAPIGAIKDIPPLPPNKAVTMVLSDFLHYIVECTRQFIIDSHVNGTVIWESPKEFILTHPNGWGGPQQFQMREAAVMGGIVPDSQDGRDSIHFLTEGEACLHYCIANNIMPRNLTESDGILIIDAGGGTIDTSAYRKRQEGEAMYEEIAIPQCFLQGSVVVSQRAHLRLEMYLAGSKYRDDISGIVSSFDKTTKLSFMDSDQVEYTHFGSKHDNDKNFNIRNGTLKLNGTTIAGFFEPSIKCMESTVLFVGGFAANEWVFKSLKAIFDPLGISIYRPDHHMAKAVADGAVSFFLESHVKARISRCAFGTFCRLSYNPNDPEHVLRKSKLKISQDGVLRFPSCFYMMIPKNTKITEDQQYRRPYNITKSTYEELVNEKFPVVMFGYFGELAEPYWIDENIQDYRVVGLIPINVTDVKHLIRRQANPSGGFFYEISFDLILFFGLTELKAQIYWTESDGEVKHR
ncbi:hypothetical protein AX16_002982 [Volvariella volvacea WC 439]|nr:hypothetical protein AX16_002982 [Volvariella volvacea WC 439]